MQDLARVRIGGPPTTGTEAVFALESWLNNSGGHFRRWHQAVTNVIRGKQDLHRRLLRFADSGLSPRELRGTPAPARPARTGAGGEPGDLVDEFAAVAVLPYWEYISGRLLRDTDAYRQIVSSSGVENLLRTLHPRVHWSAPVLEVEDDDDTTIDLQGRGLLIVPSLFLAAPLATAPHSRPVDHSPTPSLLFPIRPDSRVQHLLGAPRHERASDTDRGEALASLVGRTRAALLEALLSGTTSTNSEIADRIGVSNAAVSQHTSVLRAAGLIATLRTRNHALHTVTPLGRSLLSGVQTPAEPPQEPRRQRLVDGVPQQVGRAGGRSGGANVPSRRGRPDNRRTLSDIW
ncbi:ArsR/SmtB family transcription factor [Streptomyces sp. NPDC004111]|uniref:ArsR/SmtB family transcription factor n=1 Tax=Streptomyces sp. NPDC004111 TaxID=3364690 RepID=UPI0036A06BBB